MILILIPLFLFILLVLLLMMFLSTQLPVKRQTGIFQAEWRQPLLPLVVQILLVLLVVVVVETVVVEYLVEMRKLQNSTLEPEAGPSVARSRRPR